MPMMAPNTIDEVPKKHRRKLEALLAERSVVAYAFSWSKLIEGLTDWEGDTDKLPSVLESAVVAFADKDEKAFKDSINETIADEFTSSGLKPSESGSISLRHHDPFGRAKDFIMMRGTSTSFSQKTAMDIIVTDGFEVTVTDPKTKRQFKTVVYPSAQQVASVWERATSSRSFITVQARDVADKKGGEE